MQNQQMGVIGLPRTESGKLIVLPIHPEDTAKQKQERVRGGEQDYRLITPDMLGFVSGGVKEEDWNEGENYVMQAALLREFATEWGIEISPGQVGHKKAYIGRIEQRRNGDEIDFMVYAFWCVILFEEQVTALDKEAGEVRQQLGLSTNGKYETLKLAPEQLGQYLVENGQNFRPTALFAAQIALRDGGHESAPDFYDTNS
jgi:hypothetical protein